MSKIEADLVPRATTTARAQWKPGSGRGRRGLTIWLCFSCIVVFSGGILLWLGQRAVTIRDELGAAAELVAPLKEQIANVDASGAASTADKIRSHTGLAKSAAEDPAWTLATSIPWVGANFSAVAELSRSADDVANLGLTPLVRVFESLNWETLLPSAQGTDLVPLKAASPAVSSAAYTVRSSAERLGEIDESQLWPEIAEPLSYARNQLNEVSGALSTSADASKLLPAMAGSEAPRNYLLMIQNNAEARASGGIPGALALLTLDKGKIALGAQSSASKLGVMSPVLPLDPTQQLIYSGRLGKFMQDVNLTPDFPHAAATAQAMWEQKTGQRVDGVISLDPVVLSYLLDSTGPVTITSPELVNVANGRLPLELNHDNVVQTLLSDVYAQIEEPALQDAFFAGVAQEVFSGLSSGKASPKEMMAGLAQGAEEGRVLVWSNRPDEQALISKYPLGGAISGANVSPAQFGVYFNDGTGAKMDYYVRRTVQLVKQCPKDGYEETTVRISSTNTAPADAATSLPAYVTGDGIFGVPPGSVQTNIVAYGPVQANVETAKVDGQKTAFAPYLHSNRPVGITAIRLAPGESKTVEFTFGRIVQHTEPNVVVTPTVQAAKDVTLPTEMASCG
ncbi:DUF4012 domain-containing protein [Pseudarthrobacter oxydans]|uniref:DUF4012 domain-containing protein n=1 Tax=Pseudarthrobacter oxydans TaxID=1671 RepID=UPI003D2C448A